MFLTIKDNKLNYLNLLKDELKISSKCYECLLRAYENNGVIENSEYNKIYNFLSAIKMIKDAK